MACSASSQTSSEASCSSLATDPSSAHIYCHHTCTVYPPASTELIQPALRSRFQNDVLKTVDIFG